MLGWLERSARERSFIAKAHRVRQTGERYRREGAGNASFCVLDGPAREECVFRRCLMVDADVALIPVLTLNQVREVVVEASGTGRHRVGVDQLRRDWVPAIRRNLVA